MERLKPSDGNLQVPGWEFRPQDKKLIQDLIRDMQKNYVQTKEYNTFLVTEFLDGRHPLTNSKSTYFCTITLFKANGKTHLLADNFDNSVSSVNRVGTDKSQPYRVINKASMDRLEITFKFTNYYPNLPVIEGSINVNFIQDSGNYTLNFKPYSSDDKMYIYYSTICPTSTKPTETENLKNYIGAYDTKGYIREFINTVSPFFRIVKYCNGVADNDNNFDPPTELLPDKEQTENSSNSNTGQFGGTGKPLKDIKISLFAKKVTKGELELTNPQVELGTVPTDWRPNSFDNKEEICGLQIGGYNYVVNSAKKLQSSSNDSQKLEFQFIDKEQTMKIMQGQDITISCEVDGDIELESGGVLFQYQLEGQDTYTDVKAEVTTSSTGKKRIWIRVKLP